VTPLEEIRVPLRIKEFDFDEQQMEVYNRVRMTETFRFINWNNFSAESVTLPIDKVVANLLKDKF
jgi:hypothetical protein